MSAPRRTAESGWPADVLAFAALQKVMKAL
jgi:hypothetical protein